jgi:hypothetical protein
MEYLSHYEYLINYIKGEENTVADALSRLPVDERKVSSETVHVAAAFTIKNDPNILGDIRKGYSEDGWCRGILDNLRQGLMDVKLDFKV